MQYWKRLTLLAGLLLALAPTLAAPPVKPPALLKLTITGSSTMAPVVSDLAQRFSAQHPEVKIEVQMGGSGRGISDVREGKARIGMVSRALKPDEQDLFAFAIARDGVALVVHRDNPVRAVTRAQLADIFSSTITNWKALGGADAPVVLISRTPGRGSLESITTYTGIQEEKIKSAMLAGENTEALNALLANRNALTFFSLGMAERAVAQGSAIRLLALNGIPANASTLQDGSYPLTHPLHLVTRDLPRGGIKEFISFVLSSQALSTIEQHDFVPYLN